MDKRAEVREIMDMAIKAGEGNETEHQNLYPIFGSLSNDMAKGLVMGLGLMLREMV